MFARLVQECREAISENALNPDMHRDAVKALAVKDGPQRPPPGFEPPPPRKRRGRNPKKAQTQGPRGWRSVDEYGSAGRQFGGY